MKVIRRSEFFDNVSTRSFKIDFNYTIQLYIVNSIYNKLRPIINQVLDNVFIEISRYE